MGKVSKASAANTILQGPVEDHNEDVHGYTINFLTFSEDIDGAALLKGLPGDQCHCPHWGYVLKGKVTFKSADGEETFEAGDAYYVGPGHTPILYAGTEVVEFSPTDELQHTLEVVTRNMEAAG